MPEATNSRILVAKRLDYPKSQLPIECTPAHYQPSERLAPSSLLPRPTSPLRGGHDECTTLSKMDLEAVGSETCHISTASSPAISSIPAGTFFNVRKRHLLVPSSTALAKAEQSMARWELEINSHDSQLTSEMETDASKQNKRSEELLPRQQSTYAVQETSTEFADTPLNAPTPQVCSLNAKAFFDLLYTIAM